MAPKANKARKAVTIFSEQFRQEELRRRDADGTEISTADLNKVTAAAWKNLSTEEKSKYKRIEEREREMFGVDEPKAKGESAKPKRKTVKDKEEKENQVKRLLSCLFKYSFPKVLNLIISFILCK